MIIKPMDDEVTLYVRDTSKTGSKRLELFSSKRGLYKVGDAIRLPVDFSEFHYKPWQTLTLPMCKVGIIERIDDPPEQA